jgi:hypothetical protein
MAPFLLTHILHPNFIDIYCLFERRTRVNLRVENEPFYVAGSYKTFIPTGVTLLENLDELHIAWIFTSNEIRRELPKNLFFRAKIDKKISPRGTF